MTEYLLLRGTVSKMLHDLRKQRENEWHTGDEWDDITWKINRLDRFKRYVELHQEFTP